MHGAPFSVFAKLSPAADAREQFTAELAGLRLPAYLAIVAVDGPGLFGRRYLDRLAAAVRSYR